MFDSPGFVDESIGEASPNIPKIPQGYFLNDRTPLSDIGFCGWETVKAFYAFGSLDSKAVRGVNDPPSV